MEMEQILVEYDFNKSVPEQMSEVTDKVRSGNYRSALIHVYSGLPDEEMLVRLCGELRVCCGTDLIVGSMSAGEIMEGRMIKRGILISVILFEESQVTILRFDDVKGNEVSTGIRVRETLDAVEDLKGAEVMFPGTEMDTEHMFAEISRCRDEIQIFGGYPGGHRLNSPEHFIFDASGAMYNSMFLVTYAGKNLHFDMDKSIGWVSLGMAFKVTRAEGKHLLELDGHPAAEVYERFLQIDRKEHNNAEEAFEFPLMARQNGEDRLRSVVHIEEDGSLWLHGFVKEGMDIHLTYGDPSNIVDTVNKRLEVLRKFRPQVILLYSCVVRKTFWEDFVDMEMVPFAQMCSTAGFHTWGEILRNAHTGELGENNITLLSIGMREGDAPSGQISSVRVDDTVLQGQASVLRRLTRLVYTTMDELQRAHNQLKIMAERDALTGLYNRGTIEQMINETLKSGKTVSLVMLDLDFFKKVNDTHGHDVGDMTLRELAEIINRSMRSYVKPAAGRWGGEEFFVLLPNVGLEASSIYAERLLRSVDCHIFPVIGHQTISEGVITISGAPEKKDVYKAVDDALYRAKKAGRNRVERAFL